MNAAERNYSVTERECLAVLWVVQKFRPYVEGYHFKVISDHSSLKWLHNLKNPTGRLARWALELQQYDYEIIHRKGSQNVVADALSRLHEDDESFEIASLSIEDEKDRGIVRMERDRPMQVDAQDESGNTPLHLALTEGNEEAVESLLRKSAGSSLANATGKTPLHISNVYMSSVTPQISLSYLPEGARGVLLNIIFFHIRLVNDHDHRDLCAVGRGFDPTGRIFDGVFSPGVVEPVPKVEHVISLRSVILTQVMCYKQNYGIIQKKIQTVEQIGVCQWFGVLKSTMALLKWKKFTPKMPLP
ncbi:unnamed protein product, partial [Trichogramma brassicae]